MFTGIVEEMGKLVSIQKSAHSARLTISCHKIMEGLKVGDSICTNGVCLTATEVQGHQFSCDVMHESLNRSALGALKAGDRVNLERAMPASGRFDGHFVSGHIDGVGTIQKSWQDDVAVWYQIGLPQALTRWIVEKGSIAIDGISLTVAGIEGDKLTVSIIPHTQKETVLQFKGTGDTVNLECDMIGKYVEKLMKSADLLPGGALLENEKKKASGLTKDDLFKNGFI